MAMDEFRQRVGDAAESKQAQEAKDRDHEERRRAENQAYVARWDELERELDAVGMAVAAAAGARGVEGPVRLGLGSLRYEGAWMVAHGRGVGYSVRVRPKRERDSWRTEIVPLSEVADRYAKQWQPAPTIDDPNGGAYWNVEIGDHERIPMTRKAVLDALVNFATTHDLGTELA